MLIISGKLEANERIDEDFLSKSLNVSRTPVREAINRLEQEGWINIVPRKGMFVNNISLKEINDIFQVRSNLEPIILEMAFYKVNREDLIDLKEKFLDFSNKTSLTSEDVQNIYIIKISSNISNLPSFDFYCNIFH